MFLHYNRHFIHWEQQKNLDVCYRKSYLLNQLYLSLEAIKQLESTVVYQNKWMTVREDKVLRSDGSTGIYGVVEKTDFVVIVAVQEGLIYIVEQYRYPVEGRYWELPQGAGDRWKDSNPTETARRELREETGMIAHKMVHVGHQLLASGYSTQGFHVYLASNLEKTTKRLDHEEQDLVSAAVSLEHFESMIQSGKIKDATSVSAYSLVKLKGLL